MDNYWIQIHIHATNGLSVDQWIDGSRSNLDPSISYTDQHCAEAQDHRMESPEARSTLPSICLGYGQIWSHRLRSQGLLSCIYTTLFPQIYNQVAHAIPYTAKLTVFLATISYADLFSNVGWSLSIRILFKHSAAPFCWCCSVAVISTSIPLSAQKMWNSSKRFSPPQSSLTCRQRRSGQEYFSIKYQKQQKNLFLSVIGQASAICIQLLRNITQYQLQLQPITGKGLVILVQINLSR